jgi:hypothetical protein
VLRDVPEPALLVGSLKHERRAFVAAGVAVRSFPVRPDCALVQDGVPEPQLEAVLQHRGLAARIHDNFGEHLAIVVLLVANLHADRPVAVEEHFQHPHPLLCVDAVLTGVVQHHRVELAAHDLPGLRAFVRLVVPEVKRRRLLAL